LVYFAANVSTPDLSSL